MIDLARIISRSASWYADSVAVVDGERRLTFRDLEQRSGRLANAMRALSPDTGTRVALLLNNRQEFIEADIALIKAGKVKVPINPRLSAPEREYIISHSGADTLLFEAGMEPFVEAMRGRASAVRHFVRVGGGPREMQAHEYESLLAEASSSLVPAAVRPADPSLILYTSGTTGRPKGAVSTFASRLAATQNMLAEELEVSAGDGMIHVGPLSHGSGSKILAYFLRGARNILVRKFDPEAFFDIVEREHGTGTFMVPTMISMLVDHGGWRNRDLRSLKTITYGGAPISPTRLQQALDALGNVFVQVYGSCEAPHPVSILRKEDHVRYRNDEHHLSSLGREVTGAEVRLVGPDGGEAAAGEPGELLIRGANVMSAYWNDPEATRDAFAGDFYRSGDAAVRDPDGFLYMVDRVRDLIITGGLNVYPAEVEAALLSHPSVAEAAVIGVPDDTWGENVKAFVALRPGAQATSGELIEHCRLRLAGYKKPKSVEFVSSLPKGSTGKILKRQLRDPYWLGRERSVN